MPLGASLWHYVAELRTLSVTYPLCGSALTNTTDNPSEMCLLKLTDFCLFCQSHKCYMAAFFLFFIPSANCRSNSFTILSSSPLLGVETPPAGPGNLRQIQNIHKSLLANYLCYRMRYHPSLQGPLIPPMAFTSCHDRGSNRLPPDGRASTLNTKPPQLALITPLDGAQKIVFTS